MVLIDATTTEAADLIKISYSKAVKGMQDYNNKIIEFAHANTNLSTLSRSCPA